MYGVDAPFDPTGSGAVVGVVRVSDGAFAETARPMTRGAPLGLCDDDIK
jgi:hypothetical protein